VEIRTYPERETPDDLRAQVVALHAHAWPPDGPGDPGDGFHDPDLAPRSMLMVDDGRVVASLDVLSKGIDVAGRRYRASGLSTVVTDPAERARGHGHRLVVAAREAMEADGTDVGLFTSDPPLRSFYEGAGWTVLDGTVLVGGTPDDPLPSDSLGKVTYGGFFSPLAREHADDFRGARVALHPGRIDRLW
jgi:GNAT superfamily N-acetyltransferase